MKNSLFFLIFAVIIFSCKKENSAPIPNSENAFISFSIPGQLSAVISPSAHTVIVTMPFGIKLDSLLAANFTLPSGASIKVGTVAQTSNITLNNFISPITYTITAENGTAIQDWIITADYETYSYLLEDFPKANKTFYMYIDSTNLQGYSIGNHGKGQVWNFLNLGIDDTDTIDFLSPLSHPAGSIFTNSNLVIKDHSNSFDMFASVTENNAEIIGMYGTSNGILISVPTTNPLTYINFPSEFGVNFTDDGTLKKDTTITIPQIPIPVNVTLQLNINTVSEIDANGIVYTPLDTFKCIREFNIQTRQTQVLNPNNPLLPAILYDQTITTYTYNYFNKEKGYPVISVEVDELGNILKIKHQK